MRVSDRLARNSLSPRTIRAVKGSGFGSLFLPERAVRWLGISLMVAALMVPFAVLYLRAATWEPPAVTTEELPVLRPELVIIPVKAKFLMGSPEDEPGRNSDET